MYCIPERNKVFILCSNSESLIDYWNYIQKYKNVFAPFATYAKLTEYIMNNPSVVVPEPPITLSQYGNPEYFYDAIATKIAYDLSWKNTPQDYYYAPGRFENKPFDGAVHIHVNPAEIPGIFIPSSVQGLVDALKEGVYNVNMLGIRTEKMNNLI
jgi:hypothetical protein